MRECMVDIETWGTSPGAEIRSIGAVVFEHYKPGDGLPIEIVYYEFYANITETYWRERDSDTETFWEEQSEEAQAVFLSPEPIDLDDALRRFVEWFTETNCETIWSHGASFDIPIIENAMKHEGVTVPWKYSKIRDTRTLFEEWGVKVEPQPGYEIKHHALHDALNQAMAVLKCKTLRALAI